MASIIGTTAKIIHILAASAADETRCLRSPLHTGRLLAVDPRLRKSRILTREENTDHRPQTTDIASVPAVSVREPKKAEVGDQWTSSSSTQISLWPIRHPFFGILESPMADSSVCRRHSMAPILSLYRKKGRPSMACGKKKAIDSITFVCDPSPRRNHVH